MQIYIKTLTGKTITLEVESTMTVLQTKTYLQDKEGIPPCEQTLFIHGQRLQNNRTLAECEIKSQDEVHLILNLRG
jgi:hypothetical protein